MKDPNQREQAILQAALELPPKDRAAYLDQACGMDAQLRQRVLEALFREWGKAKPTLQPEAAPTTTVVVSSPSEAPGEKPGDRIGRYKLLEHIAEGGMGSVWVAEREEEVRLRVALKVIKLGMATKQVIARFEAERQALALMDHPNIAKALDAGSTETGRPYFVMELVRGIPITEYCDKNNLSTRQRLDLFIQACKGIQHAHQQGIIHRDIKPSNILVTLHDGVPVPKVIDFGIAKATHGQRLTEKTVYTAFEEFIGTPVYMSPEQAEMSGLGIDTRSDLYSLGALLYELLTGQTPFDSKRLSQLGPDGIRRIIREEDPPRPSTKLSTLEANLQTTVAKHRRSEPPKLIHLVRGDLDWIVMKCLEKDRTRRYETVNGLVMDIERHLNNELVSARPPSNLYRFQKLARRHRVAFAATATVIAGLSFALTAVIWMYLREACINQELARSRDEEKRAEVLATKAKDVANENAGHARQAIKELLNVSTDMNVISNAVESFRRFHEQSPGDPARAGDLAAYLQRQANAYLSSTNGDDKETSLARDKAAAAARESAVLLEQLATAYPTNALYAEAFADACIIAAQVGPPETRQAALAKGVEFLTKRPLGRWQTEQKLASLLRRMQETQTNHTEVLRLAKQQIECLERAQELAATGGQKGASTSELTDLLHELSQSYESASGLVPADDSIFYLQKAANGLRVFLTQKQTNAPAAERGLTLLRLTSVDERLTRALLDKGSRDDAAKAARCWMNDLETLKALGNEAATRSLGQAPTLLTDAIAASPVSVGDALALRLLEGKMITVKGTVGTAAWTPHKGLIQILFSDAADGFCGVIYYSNAGRIQQVFGEDLDNALAGRTLQLRGILTNYHRKPQIIVSDPAQITLTDGANSAEQLANLRATNTAALLAALYKEAIVTGTIESFYQTRDHHLLLLFKDAPKGGFIAVVYADDVVSINQALNGDATAILPGKSVRIKGRIQKYFGRQPEIVIRNPAQLVIESGHTNVPPVPHVLSSVLATNIAAASARSDAEQLQIIKNHGQAGTSRPSSPQRQ